MSNCMEFQDLKNKAVEDLKEILASTAKELRGLQTQAKLNQLKQSHKVRQLKTIIARVKSILKV